MATLLTDMEQRSHFGFPGTAQPGRHPLRRSSTVRVTRPAFARRCCALRCQHHNAARQLRKQRAAHTPKAEMSSGRSGAVTGGNVVELYMLSEFVPTSTIKVHSSLSNAAIGKALRASSGSRTGVDGGSALKMRSRKQENTAREKYYVNRNKLLVGRGEVQPASGQKHPHMPA